MSDSTKKIAAADDQALDAPKDMDKLPAGDDLALEALGDDDQPVASTNDEVAASDELAETLTALQGVIERNASKLDQAKQQLKILREQLKSVFDNDSDLQEASQQAKTFTSQVRERKSHLQSDPTVTRLKSQIGEMNEQKKEIEEALSGHLVNYYSLTNSTSFDTSDGDQREFSIKASVKGRSKKS